MGSFSYWQRVERSLLSSNVSEVSGARGVQVCPASEDRTRVLLRTYRLESGPGAASEQVRMCASHLGDAALPESQPSLFEFLNQVMKAINFVVLEGGIQMGITAHSEIHVVFFFNRVDSSIATLFAERTLLGMRAVASHAWSVVRFLLSHKFRLQNIKYRFSLSLSFCPFQDVVQKFNSEY